MSAEEVSSLKSESSEKKTSENESTNDALRDREIALREREIALKEQEIKAKIVLDNRNIWFSSPLLLGMASAVFGLIGTGVGAGLQGYSNFQLERQKFEFELIRQALNNDDRNEAAKQLLFLVDSGVIESLDSTKLRRLAATPDRLPRLGSGL
jgi:hypothetical protein